MGSPHQNSTTRGSGTSVPGTPNASSPHLSSTTQGLGTCVPDTPNPDSADQSSPDRFRGMTLLERLGLGMDVLCRFAFLQVALHSEATLCFVCDAHDVVGHAVLFADHPVTYMVSADVHGVSLNVAKGGEVSNQDLVTQLLRDVLESGEYSSTGDILTSQSLNYSISPKRIRKKYNQYGFLVWPYTGSDLVAKANSLQRFSEELLSSDIDREISLNVRWENILSRFRNRELHRTQELKTLIRAGGIPPQCKEKVWNACIAFQVGSLRERLGPRYYQNLLSQMEEQAHRHNPATKQIELDLLRTLPQNRHYESLSSDGIPKLNRVLLAYTQHNPDLGYCQGQNRLAAIALLFLNEEDAFWCLLAITEYIMPVDYYSSTLSAAQVDQRVLKDLMVDKLPQLMAHLEAIDIDLSLFTFNWFLTIFIDNVPTETYLRVWDSFLYEGNKVLFRFALAFFKYREKEIMAITETLLLHNYLRTVGENATDIDKIAQIAFHDVNPLPMRTIEARRQAHMVQVKSELAELEAMRTQFRCSRKVHPKRQQVADFQSDDDAC